MERSISGEKETKPSASHENFNAFSLLALGGLLWYAAYQLIQPVANWLSYDLLGVQQGSHPGESLAFFFYDVPKILLLLGGIIFLITVLRSFFSPEQTRAWLGGKRDGVGNLLAAALGLVIAIIAGVVIGRLKLERYVEDFVWQIQVGQGGVGCAAVF